MHPCDALIFEREHKRAHVAQHAATNCMVEVGHIKPLGPQALMPQTSRHTSQPPQTPEHNPRYITSLSGPGHSGSSEGSNPPSPNGFLRRKVHRWRSVVGSVFRLSSSSFVARAVPATDVAALSEAAVLASDFLQQVLPPLPDLGAYRVEAPGVRVERYKRLFVSTLGYANRSTTCPAYIPCRRAVEKRQLK